MRTCANRRPSASIQGSLTRPVSFHPRWQCERPLASSFIASPSPGYLTCPTNCAVCVGDPGRVVIERRSLNKPMLMVKSSTLDGPASWTGQHLGQGCRAIDGGTWAGRSGAPLGGLPFSPSCRCHRAAGFGRTGILLRCPSVSRTKNPASRTGGAQALRACYGNMASRAVLDIAQNHRVRSGVVIS